MLPDDPLSNVPLFQGLDGASRQRIAARLVERRLRPGEFLFHEGEPGAALYLVAEGEIEVLVGRSGRETTLARLGPRSYLGEMAVIDEAPRSSSARATVPTRLLEVPRDVFLGEVLSSPEASRALLAEMARRLRGTDVMVGEHLARDAVREIERHLTFGQRLAERVSTVNGSWISIVSLLAVAAAWLTLNVTLARPFDPPPFDIFRLLLILAIAVQGRLLMMSQNRQAMRDRAQAAADFQLNLKNEIGIQSLLRDLARLERRLDGQPAERKPAR
jgi:CRP/FNR family transcriptional regulator, cyclic AMP receptor protein